MNSSNSDLSSVISHHISLFFSKIGWNSVYDYKVTISKELAHLLEAFIEIGRWVINIKISDDFIPRFTKLFDDQVILSDFEKPLLLSSSEDQFQMINNAYSFPFHNELHELLSSLILHEVGHSRECPIDSDCFASIIHGITTALKTENHFGQKTLIYLANQFTDIIVNTTNGLESENRFVRNGFALYYYVQITQTGKNTKDFLYFLLINIYLFISDVKLQTLLEEKIILQMTFDYQSDIEKLIGIFCPYEPILQKIMQKRLLTESEKWKILNYISQSEFWGELAFDFAKEMIPHLQPEPEIQPNKINSNSFTKKFQTSKDYQKEIFITILDHQDAQKNKKRQQKQRQKQQKIEEKGKNTKNNTKSNTTGSKKSKDQELIDQKIKDGTPFPGFLDIEKSSAFLVPYDLLDCLYKKRIKKINLNITKNANSYQLPINWMNRSIMTERDNPLQFDPLNTYFIPKSNELMMFKKSLPLMDNSKGAVKGEGFPNLSIIYDDSGSMDWDIFKGRGKYDAVIIMIYSIFQWLAQQSFAPVIKYNLTAFSSTTRSSGWVDYYSIESFLPLLFNKENGGTRLDPEIFAKLLRTPQKQAMLLITDGELYNEKKFLEVLEQNRLNVHFLMVEIGRSTNIGKKLKNKGFNVSTIENISHLSEIALDFMNASYHRTQ